MSVSSEVLRPFWLTGISEISGKAISPFKGWLTEGQFIFLEKKAPEEFVFLCTHFNEMMRAQAHDINKFSMASLESIHGIPSSLDVARSAAWTSIRAYYAAFFSTHALSRILGYAISQLDNSHILKLNEAISLVDSNHTKLEAGLYRLELFPVENTFSIKKIKKNSHEGTWNEFGITVEKLSKDILLNESNSTVEAQNTSIMLGNLLEIFKTDHCQSGYNWLSYIRNQINYQLTDNVWYPHEGSSKFRAKMNACIALWRKDPLELDGDNTPRILKFTKACVLTVALMRVTLLEIKKRNSLNDSFLNYGTSQLLSQCL
ncbi:MAG: hypothetical protein QE263_00590 [Vampirovibrionales bacterium]|nr:hypothetical protein [Vampirovibrionales bacterium]